MNREVCVYHDNIGLDSSRPAQAAFLKPVARAAEARGWEGRMGDGNMTRRFERLGSEDNSLKLLGIALTVAMGGFLVGFDATVISGAVPFIRDYFGLSSAAGTFKLGWAVSSLGWGAMAGNLCAGPLSDRWGRRTVLLLTAVLFLASSLTAALTTSFTLFIAARVVGGLGVGAAILIAPLYIAEIAPAGSRGSLVSVNQLMIVIGISVSFFSNYFLLSLGTNSWRWMLGVQSAPAALYFLLLYLVPESPRWLMSRGREADARAVLEAVHGRSAAPQFDVIRANLANRRRHVGVQGLLSPRLRRMMLFGLGIAFFQQATGINAIFYYLPTIFAQAGGELSTSFAQSVLVGLVNLGVTFVAIWLIDRVGRRPLLCVGVAGMALSLFAIGWAFHAGQGAAAGAGHERIVLVAIITYVASFAFSLGPVMWVLLSEIFPNEERAAAISVVGFWNSLVSASVTLLFPAAVANLGPDGTFFVYALLALAGFLFLTALAPETRGKTLEDLERVLTRPLRGGEA
jgi:sugar porter (SP) family MFS transporter